MPRLSEEKGPGVNRLGYASLNSSVCQSGFLVHSQLALLLWACDEAGCHFFRSMMGLTLC